MVAKGRSVFRRKRPKRTWTHLVHRGRSSAANSKGHCGYGSNGQRPRADEAVPLRRKHFLFILMGEPRQLWTIVHAVRETTRLCRQLCSTWALIARPSPHTCLNWIEVGFGDMEFMLVK